MYQWAPTVFLSVLGMALGFGCSCSPVNQAVAPVEQSGTNVASTQVQQQLTPLEPSTMTLREPSPGATSRAQNEEAPVLESVNLLHAVKARVAVSSAVRNPRDFPEYLVDNHLETAWNGGTGDLVGGWMEFEISRDATVRRIALPKC
jgi:hypothetical protein